jgi:hypothetical protein
MTRVDQRKSLRRSISYPATIIRGNDEPAMPCALCNASQEGAQLVVAEPEKVPDRFLLALSADGAARRKCQVVWRSGGQIGVRFLKPAKKTEATAGARMMRHLAVAAKAAPAEPPAEAGPAVQSDTPAAS